MRRITVLKACLALSLALTACGGDGGDDQAPDAGAQAAAAEPAQLTITSHEFKFEVDAPSVPAGLVEITLNNEGKVPHQVQLFKLNEGTDFEAFKKALMGPPGPPAGLSTGGVAAAAPGTSGTAVVNLSEGSYALVCFFEGHHTKGMMQPFEVTAAEETDFAAPEAEGQISLSDFEIILPDGFDGQGTFEVVNNGPQPHEAQLFEMDASLQELQKYLENPKGPPPGGEPVPAGGFGGIENGDSGYLVDLDLEPGVYAFVCFVPDQKTGKPHIELGMATPFEVE